MSVDIHERLARRYTATATTAGWASLAGTMLIATGLTAHTPLLPAWMYMLTPIGTSLLLVGGIVPMLADSLASRYRDPGSEESES